MAQTPIGPGTLLAGRFELEDLLAESEGARFYRASDRVLVRDVAVHVVAADDPRSPALLSAARTSTTVSDGHLLRVLDAATESGITYVVNEWGAGISLDKLLLVEGPLSPRRAAWLVREVAEAVAVAHRHGIAHGRLIPENVVISDSGAVKLVGFVVDAAIRGRERQRVTGGAPLGEHEADVVNLGALLYAGLVAKWPGTQGSQLPTAPSEQGRTFRPRQVRAGVPRPLDAICERVLNAGAGTSAPPLETAHEVYAALSEYIGDPAAAVPMGLDTDPDATQVGVPVFDRTDRTDRADGADGADGADDPEATRLGASSVTSTASMALASGGLEETVAAPRSGAVAPPPPVEELPARPLFAPDAPRRDRPDRLPDGRTPQAPPPAWGPDAGRTGEVAADPDADWRRPRPGRRWMRLAGALGGLLLVLVAVFFLVDLQQPASPPSAEETPPRAPVGSPDAVPSPVAIASVTDFDPGGDPPAENSETAALAADRDPSTVWRTSTYYDPLEEQKAGVGLLVDLGAPETVSEVVLTLVGSPSAVELLVADRGVPAPTSTDGLTRVARNDSAGPRTLLQLEDPATTRYVVVWLTSLPVVEGGFAGQVAEIVVRS